MCRRVGWLLEEEGFDSQGLCAHPCWQVILTLYHGAKAYVEAVGTFSWRRLQMVPQEFPEASIEDRYLRAAHQAEKRQVGVALTREATATDPQLVRWRLDV